MKIHEAEFRRIELGLRPRLAHAAMAALPLILAAEKAVSNCQGP